MARARFKTRRPLLETLEWRMVLDGDGAPWLMAPDLTISFAPDGTDIAGYSNTLHATLDPVAPTAAWQAVVVRAFETWAQHIGTAVNVVGDGGNPFGAPGFTQGDPQFGDVRVGAVPLQSDVIAISIPHNDVVSGTWAGDILFNSNAALDNLDDLFSVALHEAGHVFGLGHSTAPDSVMYWHGISPWPAPTAEDIAALQQLYGRTEAVDDFFNAFGDGDDHADGDDDPETPHELVNYRQLPDAIRFDATGEISWPGDVDFYQLGPLDEVPGDLEVLTVTVWAANAQSLAPSVQFLTSEGKPLKSRILSNSGGRIVLQADDASPEDALLVKVQAANPTGDLINGTYRLSARFDATQTRLVDLAKGSLAAADPAAARMLHVSQTSLMHLLLEVDRTDKVQAATVNVVVSDASGQVVARIDSHLGNTQSAPTLLLNPGDYRVEISAAAAADQSLPELNYTLRGTAISIPIGSVPVDPTADPTMICDAATGSTCTLIDAAVTTPILASPLPPLAPPPNSSHNVALPMDVNGDGIISPLDALTIINYLNSVGLGTLGLHTPGDSFLDVNNDGSYSAVDALWVLNALNAAADQAAELASATPSPDSAVVVAMSLDSSALEILDPPATASL